MQSLKRFVLSKWALLGSLTLLFLAQIWYLTATLTFTLLTWDTLAVPRINEPIVHEYFLGFVAVLFGFYLVRGMKARLHRPSIVTVIISAVYAILSGYLMAALAMGVILGTAFLSVSQTVATLRKPPETIITDPVRIIDTIGTTVPRVADTIDALYATNRELSQREFQPKDSFYHNVALPFVSYFMWLPLVDERYPPMWYLPKSQTLATIRVTEPTLRQVIAPLARNAIIRKYGSFIRSDESFSVIALPTKQYIEEVNKRQEQYIQRSRDALQEIRDERSSVQSTISSNNAILSQVAQDDPFYAELKGMVEMYNGDMYSYIADLNKAEEMIQAQIDAMEKNPLTAERQSGLYSGTVVYLRYFNEEDIFQQTFERYFATAVHEYLHALSSHGATEDELESFMEEGTTDYLTGEILPEVFYPSPRQSWYGYVSEVELMKELMKDVSERTVLEMYFTKQEDTMRSAFEQKYPGVSYDSFKKEASIMHMQRVNREEDAINQAKMLIQQIRQGATPTPGLPISH